MQVERRLKIRDDYLQKNVDYLKLIGRNLRLARLVMDYSIEDLEDFTKISRKTIGELENGKCNVNIAFSIIFALQYQMGIHPILLFTSDIDLEKIINNYSEARNRFGNILMEVFIKTNVSSTDRDKIENSTNREKGGKIKNTSMKNKTDVKIRRNIFYFFNNKQKTREIEEAFAKVRIRNNKIIRELYIKKLKEILKEIYPDFVTGEKRGKLHTTFNKFLRAELKEAEYVLLPNRSIDRSLINQKAKYKENVSEKRRMNRIIKIVQKYLDEISKTSGPKYYDIKNFNHRFCIYRGAFLSEHSLSIQKAYQFGKTLTMPKYF